MLAAAAVVPVVVGEATESDGAGMVEGNGDGADVMGHRKVCGEWW